jgi:hypothetical protein
MKRLIFILMVAFLAACNDDGGGKGIPSHWGRPLTEVTYEDATGARVYETTTWYYDFRGRLTGYLRASGFGHTREEMRGSEFSGRVHTYVVDDYEVVGIPLPVVFNYTDTYTDDSFTTLESRRVVGQENMTHWQRTITYRYENGRLAGYHTVEEGAYPKDFETRVEYRVDLRPSAKAFPESVEDEANRVEIVCTDGAGDRTGYYNDNDYCRARWNFTYGDGCCTYYTSQFGQTDMPQLVRVVFYPENK